MEVGKVIKRGEDLENEGNLFWVYQNGNFLPGKNISLREQNQENDFAPSEKYACYAPGHLGGSNSFNSQQCPT